MTFLDLTYARYSCRHLQDREVEPEKIAKIIEAGMNAPTACNYQPAKIFVFESAEGLAGLRKTSHQQFVQGAPVVFVIGADPKTAWVREFDKKNFAEVDASIIATQMMLEIQDLGLGTTWVGHFDEGALKQEFPQLADYELIALFAVGYPAEGDVPSAGHTKSKTIEEMVERI